MRKKQLLASILALSMTASAFSVCSYAVDDEKPSGKSYSSENVYIISEEQAKRNEYEKHFMLSDGNHIVVSYSEQVHYLNEDGKFEEADFGLEAIDGKIEKANGDYKISLPEKYGSFPISVSDHGRTASWTLGAEDKEGNICALSSPTAEIVKNEAKQSEIRYIDDPSSFFIEKSSGTVLYKGLFEGHGEADARYTFSYGKTEEDIIIGSPTSLRTFIMNVSVDGEPEIKENGSVVFIGNDGSTVLTVGVPNMLDANEELLTDIDVKTQKKDGVWQIRYTPDEKWLEDSGRKYPIVFDPSVTASGSANITDTYVYQGTTGDNSSAGRLYIGVKSGKIYRTYIKLNSLPEILQYNTILSANLSFTLYSTTTTGKTASCHLSAGAWNTSTLTYANQPGASTKLSSSVYSTSNIHTFDVTSYYTRLKNGNANNGLVIKYDDETNTSPDWNSIYSSEYTSHTSYRPIFTAVYGSSIETGTYYVNNKETGKYFVRTSAQSVGSKNGLLSQIYDDLEWKLTSLGDDVFYIQPAGNLTYYLGIDTSGSLGVYEVASGNLNNRYKWNIDYVNHGEYPIYIQNAYNNKYLTSNANYSSVSLSSSLASASVWRIAPVAGYNELTSFTVDNMILDIGESKTPHINKSVYTTWADVSDFTFTTSSADIVINNSPHKIKAVVSGSYTVAVKHIVSGIICLFDVEVSPLLIYRSRNRETMGFANANCNADITPIVQEDLIDGDLSTQFIINCGSAVALGDLYSNVITEEQYTVSERINTFIKPFFHAQVNNDIIFCNILDEMIDHFADGSGTPFSNDDLTQAVKNHSKTITFVDASKNAINDCIFDCNADILSLKYDESLWITPVIRLQQPVVDALCHAAPNNQTLILPVFGLDNGVPGLTLALDSLEGMKIEISEFSVEGNNYSGVLKYTFYDHYGLDLSDLNEPKYGSACCNMIPAFRQWYLMQHWEDLECVHHPKPFVTNVSFDVPIYGTLS